jgi:hypothetical protein
MRFIRFASLRQEKNNMQRKRGTQQTAMFTPTSLLTNGGWCDARTLGPQLPQARPQQAAVVGPLARQVVAAVLLVHPEEAVVVEVPPHRPVVAAAVPLLRPQEAAAVGEVPRRQLPGVAEVLLVPQPRVQPLLVLVLPVA